MPKTPVSALAKAMDLLAARPLSERELLTRLRRAGYSDAEADAAIDECRQRRYLDDELLTHDAVEGLRQRNLGSRQIQLRLRRRGLEPERIHEELRLRPEDEWEAALRARDTKARQLSHETDPRKKREKLFRFLVGRGFAPELIFRVLGTENDGEEPPFTDD